MKTYIFFTIVAIFRNAERGEGIQTFARKVNGIRGNDAVKSTMVLSKNWYQCLMFCTGQTDVTCSLVSFNTDTGQCDSLNRTNYALLPSSNWDHYYVGDLLQWEMVFLASAGSGFPVYYTWTNVHPGSNDPSICSISSVPPCDDHFRNPLLDVWDNLSVNKVKVELFKDGISKKYLTFDGTDSSRSNWFSQNRLLESSWTGLKAAIDNNNIHTLNILGSLAHGRSFVIYRNYGGCYKDHMWMAVIDTHTVGSCVYDLKTSPAFLYATEDDGQRFEMDGYEEADILAVYIQRH